MGCSLPLKLLQCSRLSSSVVLLIHRGIILAMFVLFIVGPSLICTHSCLGMWSNTEEAAPACTCHLVANILGYLAVKMYFTCTFYSFLTVCCCHIFITVSSKVYVHVDEELKYRKGRVLSVLWKVEILDELHRGSALLLIGCHYGKQVICFIK